MTDNYEIVVADYAQSLQARQGWESLWQECYDYALLMRRENNVSNNLPITSTTFGKFMQFRANLRTNDTGVFARGDAAFADYSLSFGVGYRF
jgi:hypothetical protein